MLDRVSPAKTRSIAGTLLISLSMLPMLQGALITPLLALIRESANDGQDVTFLLRLMMVAPAFAMILLIPLAGRFSDRFERGHILVLGLILYGACGLAAFISPNLEWILASRFLLGVALALIMTITTASTGDIFAPPERNQVLGLQYLASTGIGMTAPALAGCIALIDWRLNFLLYLVALVLIAPAPALQRYPSDDGKLAEKTAMRLEIRPVLGIFALAAVGTTALWLLTLQFAFHLAEIGYASPVVAGLGLGAPCLAGMASGVIYPVLARHLSLRLTAALAFVLMGLGYAIISFATGLPALGIGLLLGRIRIWLQSAQLHCLAAEPGKPGCPRQGCRGPHVRHLPGTTGFALHLRSPGVGAGLFPGDCAVSVAGRATRVARVPPSQQQSQQPPQEGGVR